MAYRIYLTDSIQAMAQGKHLKERFADLIYSKPVDDKPAAEIARDILSEAGVEVISDGECI